MRNINFNIRAFLTMFVVSMCYSSHTFQYNKQIITFALVMCCCLLWSQNNSIPRQTNSSRIDFSKKGYNANSASGYFDSANYYTSKAPLRAIDFINKSLEQSIRENNQANESKAYLVLGNIQQQLQQHDLAIENYKKCLDVFKNRSRSKISYSTGTDQSVLFYANKQMAMSYVALNKLNQAEETVENCFDFMSIPLTEVLSAKRLLAQIKRLQNQPKESVGTLNDVLTQEKQINHIVGEIETYLALGESFRDLKNDDKAIDYFAMAKSLAEKNNLSGWILKANNLQAEIFRNQKNVTKELEARNSNIIINYSTNNTQAVINERLEMGNAFLNSSQMDKAQPYFEKGLAEFSNQTEQTHLRTEDQIKSADLDQTANTYKLLAKEYLKQKNTEKSLDYFNRYAVLQDSIKRLRQRELEDAILLSNNLGKNQQRIDLLEKERELTEKSLGILKQDQDLKDEQLDFKNIVITILVLFLMFVGVAGYVMMRNFKEKRKANQLLALKSLRGQMNPHFIFNALNSVNHYISQNDERQANRYLSDFSKLMRMVMDSSKHSLISLQEEMEMLKLYLQLEHARFPDKFNYTLDSQPGIQDSDFELPPMLIQPYLENAVWHGLRYLDEQGVLSLVFEKRADELVVIITDNGIGRKNSHEQKTMNQKKQVSIGMQNIENRIVIMNDLFQTNIRVKVSDAFPDLVNCGTQVKLYIPQKRNDET